MSKFIELTHSWNRIKFFQNTEYIRRVEASTTHLNRAILYLSNKEKMDVQESYEEVVNMIKFAPEVYDIMRENHDV